MKVGIVAAVAVAGAAYFYISMIPKVPLPTYEEILSLIRDPNIEHIPTRYPPICNARPEVVEAIWENHWQYNQGGTHRHPEIMSDQERARQAAIENLRLLQEHERQMEEWRNSQP